MGHSLVKNYIHLVFSTKHRQHLIHPPVEAELHSYLGGICNNPEHSLLRFIFKIIVWTLAVVKVPREKTKAVITND